MVTAVTALTDFPSPDGAALPPFAQELISRKACAKPSNRPSQKEDGKTDQPEKRMGEFANASMQGVEVGNAVDAEDDSLACRFLQRGLDDPRIAGAPIVAVAAEQAHAASIALNDQAVAVVFDFVEPVRGRRDDLAAGRKAG
jgi:hypothetical protein